jgi:hypothetical protein
MLIYLFAENNILNLFEIQFSERQLQDLLSDYSETIESGKDPKILKTYKGVWSYENNANKKMYETIRLDLFRNIEIIVHVVDDSGSVEYQYEEIKKQQINNANIFWHPYLLFSKPTLISNSNLLVYTKKDNLFKGNLELISKISK